MYPEKIRRGSHFVYTSETPTTYMKFYAAAEYCYTSHNAELPSLYVQEDPFSLAAYIFAYKNGMSIAFSVQALKR